MSTIKLTLPESTSVNNGLHVTFKAPCDSTGVTKLNINNTDYQLRNVYGAPISEGANLIFKQGAMVYVIVDADNNIAFLQNVGGIESFNGRTGAIVPQAGDYTAAMVGAAPEVHTHTMKMFGNSADDVLDVEHGGTGVTGFDELVAAISNRIVARFG